MLTTQHIIGATAFDQLANEWDALAQTGITDTPFQTLAYQLSWWQHLGKGELHTIVVCDGDSIIAIAPLYLLDGVLQFNGSKEESDYLDVLVSAENAQYAWQAIFDCLCSQSFPVWACCDFYNIPAESPSRNILANIAAERGFSFASEVVEVCPIIELPATFSDYLSSINSRQAKEIRRKLRRAKGAEVQLKIVDHNDDLTEAVDQFLDLLQKSTPEKSAWLNQGRTALFHDVAQAALANGTLELMFLEIDGRKGTTLFNFNYKGRTWVYNSGLDPDAFHKLSLGVVLTSMAIETAIESGNTTFDFLRGDEEYKYRFGSADTEIYRILIERRGDV